VSGTEEAQVAFFSPFFFSFWVHVAPEAGLRGERNRGGAEIQLESGIGGRGPLTHFF